MIRRMFPGLMGSLLALAAAGPAIVLNSYHALAPEAVAPNVSRRARRRRMVAGGYKAIRSKGDPSRRKRKVNRLQVSRRARHRHRRQRRAA